MLTARSASGCTSSSTGSLNGDGAGGDRDAILAAEGQLAVRAGHDAGPVVAQRDAGGADLQRPIAVGVRDPHPQPLAADADPRIQADRVVVEAGDAFRRGRSRRPGADPTFVAWHDHPRFLPRQPNVRATITDATAVERDKA